MALETPSWLNLDFVQDILRRSEDDNSIQVTDIFTKSATDKGDNYTSDMVRVYIEFTRNAADLKTTEKKSIIVKISPLTEGPRKDLIMKSNVFDVEMLMMTDTLKKMNEYLDPAHRLNGRALHVQKEDPAFLVMEDLAPLGFVMADRQAGLDLEHCLLAIRGLARFHASSVALFEKEPEQKKIYHRGIFSPEYPEEFRSFFSSSLELFAKEVETWPEFGKRYADKLANLSTTVYEKGVDVLKCNDDEFSVLNHGDSWVNNMLFKYDDEGKPVGHIFVDFQMCVYSSPAIDLLYFLNTSPCEEVYDNQRQTLIEEYHRTLLSTMAKIGCKTMPPSIAEIKQQMKQRAMYGMIAAFGVLPIVVCDRNEVKDLNELMPGDGTCNNTSYKGTIYRRLMTKRLPMYEEMGLLDL